MRYYKYERKETKKILRKARIMSFIPESLYELLLTRQDEGFGSVNKLICWALINELKKGDEAFKPIKRFADLPTYTENEFISQATKIYKFLEKYADSFFHVTDIMLYHLEIGLKDEEEAWRGYFDLVKTGLVIEFTPPPTKNGYVYEPSYKVMSIKPKQKELSILNKRIKRRVEKEQEDV